MLYNYENEKFGFPKINSDEFNDLGTRENVFINGKPIVVCLGCSHTYGHCSNDKTYSAFLELFIPKYQFLNSGIRGYGLKLIIDWFNLFHKKRNPEIVIIQVPLFCRQPYLEEDVDKLKYYTSSHGAYSLVINNIITQDKFLSISPRLIKSDVDRLEKFLNNIQCKNPIVLLYKSHSDHFWFMSNLVDMHHQEIVKMCKKNNIHCIHKKDLNNIYFKKNNMLIDPTHPNEKGNNYIAKVIYEFLQQSKIIIDKSQKLIL